MAQPSAQGPGAEPHRRPKLNCRTLFVLGAMNMIDCINVNLLTPYVDRMVSEFLHTTPDDPQVGHVVGLLVGLYSLCEVCFSIFWGTLADRIGRKPALLIGLAGSVAAPIMFGLGTSLPTVFAARALDGFFCGNMGVTRTYLGEIVDESNEAKGFGFLAVCFSMGLFLGPMLGGELVYPAEFAPGIFGGTIFETYPFLLPNLTYACFAAVAWVIGAVFLEETLPRDGRRRCCGQRPPPLRRQISSQLGADPSGTPARYPLREGEEADTASCRRPGWCYPSMLLQVIVAYCGIAGFSSAGTQLFVLIVSFPRSSDGFGFGPREIGLLQNVAAVGLLLTQLLLYPFLTKRFGFLRCFLAGWVIANLDYLLFPLYGLCADPERFGLWRMAPLAAMQFTLAVGGGLMFPTAFAFINRASEGLDKGAVNGWANSSGALCRALFPPASAYVLSLGSQSSLPTAVGRYMAIYVNSLVGTIMVLVALPGLRKVDRRSPRKPAIRQTDPAASSSDSLGDPRRTGREPLVGA